MLVTLVEGNQNCDISTNVHQVASKAFFSNDLIFFLVERRSISDGRHKFFVDIYTVKISESFGVSLVDKFNQLAEFLFT